MIGPQHLCLQGCECCSYNYAIVKIAVILLKNFLNSVIRLKTGQFLNSLNISGFINVQHKTYEPNID